MTIVATPPAAHPPAAFRHVDLPPHQRWGCAVRGRGRGVVVAAVMLGALPYSVEVVLEDGARIRAWPGDVSNALALVPA